MQRCIEKKPCGSSQQGKKKPLDTWNRNSNAVCQLCCKDPAFGIQPKCLKENKRHIIFFFPSQWECGKWNMMATGSGVNPRNLAGTDYVGTELRRVEIYVWLFFSFWVGFFFFEKSVQRYFASNSGSGVNWEQDFVFVQEHICAAMCLHLVSGDWI